MDKIERDARVALKRQWWVGMSRQELAFVLDAERWIEARMKQQMRNRTMRKKIEVLRAVARLVKAHEFRIEKDLPIEKFFKLCK